MLYSVVNPYSVSWSVGGSGELLQFDQFYRTMTRILGAALVLLAYASS